MFKKKQQHIFYMEDFLNFLKLQIHNNLNWTVTNQLILFKSILIE
jgi:hypothetical protein